MNFKDYRIRAVEPPDLPALIHLFGKHAAHERVSFDPNNKECLLHDAIFGQQPSLFCRVVEGNKKVVGYASYTFDYSTWDAAHFLYLDCLYLEPEYRNAGIGETLMKELVETARKNNCVNIQWQTPDFNAGAIRFYERIGGLGQNKIRFSYALR